MINLEVLRIELNYLEQVVKGILGNKEARKCFLQVGIPQFCKVFPQAPVGNFYALLPHQ